MGDRFSTTPLCALKELGPRLCQAIVTIPRAVINTLYHETAMTARDHARTHGFSKGETPLSYIKEHYKTNLTEHLKEFLFKYCVLSDLYKQLHEKNICVAGDPRLQEIIILPDKDAQFVFELSLSTPIDFREWKLFPFRAPKRKNYKDIDRQVELFIKEEEQACSDHASDKVQIGDWICLDIFLVNKKQEPLIGTHRESVWLKIGNEEADSPFFKIFLSVARWETNL